MRLIIVSFLQCKINMTFWKKCCFFRKKQKNDCVSDHFTTSEILKNQEKFSFSLYKIDMTFWKKCCFFGKNKKNDWVSDHFIRLKILKKKENFLHFSKKCDFYDIKSTWLFEKNVVFSGKTKKMTWFQTISQDWKFVKIRKILTFFWKKIIFTI